ncbi:hypothetical protein BJ165DRAFT_575346 [Panaeolus papilionaceus]|nr:hypothetical protein BJ165DRAFT_575346 [Panaeolus papilionaceus]
MPSLAEQSQSIVSTRKQKSGPYPENPSQPTGTESHGGTTNINGQVVNHHNAQDEELERWGSLSNDAQEEILCDMDKDESFTLCFKNYLSDSNIAWQAILSRHDAPQSLRGKSDKDWALCLFGKKCQDCHSRDLKGLKVEFLLEKRLCDKCRATLRVTFSSSILNVI